MPDGECTHLWNSVIGYPSKVIECDWCTICSVVRPGFMDPRDKWRTDDEVD